MKMSDLEINEASIPPWAKTGMDAVAKYGPDVWQATKDLGNRIKPFGKGGFDKATAAEVDTIRGANKTAQGLRQTASSDLEAARIASANATRDAAYSGTKVDPAAAKQFRDIERVANKTIAANPIQNEPARNVRAMSQNIIPTVAGVAAVDAATTRPGEQGTVSTGIGNLVHKLPGTASNMISGSDKPTAAAQEEPNPFANTAGANEAPPHPSSTPAEKEQQEESVSIKDLLKLSGQRAITERDATSGLVKGKPIKTLTESKLDECGMMGSPGQSASLSISATAGSGDEVANMLMSIMHLAGVKPVSHDMMGSEPSPVTVSPLQVLGGEHEHEHEMDEPEIIDIEMDGDSMNDSDFGDEEEVDEDHRFHANTTPSDPTDVPSFDPNSMADMRNYMDMAEIPPGAPGDNRLPKEEKQYESIKEAHTLDLFKAYEAYKNGQ